jgi:uncharacterized membrane protein YsdA (DUF1294 family)
MTIYMIYLAVFLLLSMAIFLISGLDKKIAAERRRGRKAETIRLRKRPLFTKITRLEQNRRRLVAQVKLPEPVYWLLAVLRAVIGAVIGKFFFYNAFFSVAVGILGALSPRLYLSFKLTQSKSQRIGKLQSSMMLLSNSYIVTEDFLKSVQDNIDVLEYAAPFRNFLTYVSLINGSVTTGLRRMELQVDNQYFSQWVDALVMAQVVRRLKTVAMSVVDAMNDVHQAQMEADTAMFTIWREYFTVLALIFAAPVIFRVLMKSILVHVSSFP